MKPNALGKKCGLTTADCTKLNRGIDRLQAAQSALGKLATIDEGAREAYDDCSAILAQCEAVRMQFVETTGQDG